MWPKPTPTRAFVERRERLQARLDRPALLVSGLSRPRNFAGNRYPFRAESHFLYFVGQALEGAALLVTPDRSVLYAPEPDPEEELWSGAMPTLDDLANSAGLEVRPLSEFDSPPEALTVPAQDADSAAFQSELLGREIEAASGDDLPGADATLADALIEIRLIHDAAAVDQLRQAAEATAWAHQAGMAATRPGVREAAVRAQMEAAYVAWGYSSSYNPIVTSHGEVLHATQQHRELAAGDLLLADVGAETPEGWAGDVTRTWPVNGRFSATQKSIYEVVLAAQKAAIEAVRPGVRYAEVHRRAGHVLVEGLVALGILRGDPVELAARGAAALFFPHGIGHLIGLDVHDLEDLGDRAGYAPGRNRSTRPGDRYLRLDRDLQVGMAVTIEPGYYRIPRILERAEELGDLEQHLDRDVLSRFADVRGIRIEDDVLVTARGSEVLTRAIVKDVDGVEAAVGVGMSS